MQYDEAIIKNLGLNLKVVFAGSQQAELAALDAAYAKQEPFLFYYWTPEAAFAKYDLTNVKLPEYTAECEAKGAEARDCDYPEDVLYKAGWAGLKAWNGWLDLKRLELTQGCADRGMPPASGRIEIADLRERVRKLEAIAAGIDI